MAEHRYPFDLEKAIAGAKNIWTRAGLEVKFAGYNPDAAANEVVQVWVDEEPYHYPADGRFVDPQTDDPLDLQMVTNDEERFLNVYSVGGLLFTNAEQLQAVEAVAEGVGALQPNYLKTVSTTFEVVRNIPE